MQTISTVHDPEGRFIPLINQIRNHLRKNFNQAVIAHTATTSKKVISQLKKLGFNPILGGKFGESRKMVLKKALQLKSNHFFCCDFDKIIHWILTAPEELKSLLKTKPEADFVVLGRNKTAWSSYPDSWIKTETIINRLVAKIIGIPADIYTTVYILNRQAAEVIAQNAQEKNWGACAEWPLLAYKAGLKLDHQECQGLSWEDPDRFQKEIKEAGNLELWKQIKYDSVQEWKKRLSSALEQITVIEKFETKKLPSFSVFN